MTSPTTVDCACWVISDGTAGNEKQALALALALGQQARIVRISLRAPWRWLAPTGPGDPRKALPTAQRALLTPPWPRLVVGCGRAAALVTLGVKRLSGGATRIVQVLDPRKHRQHYDVLVVPEHDDLRGDNVVTTIGALNQIDDAWLAAGRESFPDFAELPSPRTAVLVGGPTRSMRLDGRYVDGLLAILDHWRQRDGGSFLVTCSRRTPPGLARRLRNRFESRPDVFWANDDDGENPYAGLMGWADRIVVTPDSANLISEACATGTPVHFYSPRPMAGKIGRLLRELTETGCLRPLKLEYQPWSYAPLRELPRIAAQLRARLAVLNGE